MGERQRQDFQRRFSLEAGSLDGSDEDGGPVEVTFDLGNAYRRKSSLVSSSETSPLRQRAAGRQQPRVDCIVHHLLEEQKRSEAGSSSPSSSLLSPGGFAALRAHPAFMQYQNQLLNAERARQLGSLAPEQQGQGQGQGQNPQRTSPPGFVIVEAGDNEDDGGCGGQPDQLAWTQEMARSISERDMISYQELLQLQQQQQQGLLDIGLTNSRLLTKKQLTDMAWGVRELSRRLSTMRIRSRARNIFVLTKIHDSDLIQKTRDVAEWLLSPDRDDRFYVWVQRLLRTNKKFDAPALIEKVARQYARDRGVPLDEAREDVERRLRYWDEEICRLKPQNFDLVITLGGDGTVLYASWLFQRIVPPVLSFSLGSLGFLTKFDFDNFRPILESAFSEGVTVSLRLRFECTVMRSVRKRLSAGAVAAAMDAEDEEERLEQLHRDRDLVEELLCEESDDADSHTHSPDGTYEILNEVVVDRGPNPTMSYIELFGDDEHFTSVSADGICVSTPTGSTAYNLAAGGSLCHPENPVMLVTSICAHTLSFRPIIVPDTIVLRVGVPYDARTDSWASFDGRERVEMHPGDYVTISASRYPFASVQPHGRRSEDWVRGIRGKLGWNTRQKQKGYKEWEQPKENVGKSA